ncbi:acetoin utilization protein AcuC [Actinobacteria bacterium YIM 96077]|uniref:Acetoin utilization protein AcuC n=2 Tax=Phytoactinopolyspora halophila TaxID=1981511 RepID=A0A329QL96_9ACTN|nr:acetoin utilization protein AcuC [Actinobacteria bacterium YIM 96077]RAW13090.1 acetoin utilization protein AcuC [Phytoactinopolyspora halophila]
MVEPDTTVHVSWDDELTSYNFGPGHPMDPVRLALTIRLARDLGILDLPGVHVVPPEAAPDDVLTSVHTPDFVAAVRAASADTSRLDLSYGLGTGDVPCFEGMHDVSAKIVGGTVAAARAVWERSTTHAANIAGGLHHAMPGLASGFCVYNDVAVGIQTLLDAGAQRIAYVDVDVHHGDGVQAVFYDDPRVLTISLHESPQTLFPGTGHPSEVGSRAAEGAAVNVAIPPGTGDAGWLRAFHAVVPPLLRAWQPQMLVTQHGCDSHLEDPLAHLALTVDGQRASYASLHALAHELCEGRWLATGGGGYALVDVVPRAWTHLLAIAAGSPIDPQTPVPAAWREYVRAAGGVVAPSRMTDGAKGTYTAWEQGFDPADAVDQAIRATRSAVFPLHGLDPGL